MDRKSRPSPVYGGKVECAAPKPVSKAGEAFSGPLEHLDRTVEPMDGERREAIKQHFGQQPLTTAQLENDAGTIKVGKEGSDYVHLVVTLGDEVATVVNE